MNLGYLDRMFVVSEGLYKRVSGNALANVSLAFRRHSRRSEANIVWLSVVWVALLVLVFATLISAVLLDAPARAAMGGQSDLVLWISRLLSRLGKSDWILVPTGVALIVLSLIKMDTLSHHARERVFRWNVTLSYVFIGVGLPSILATVFKFLIGRPRPYIFDGAGLAGFRPLMFDPSFASFPSGHSTTIGAFAMVMALLAPRFRIGFAVMALLVGFSRVMLGVHYPSDVVAGLLFGATMAYVVAKIFSAHGLLFLDAPATLHINLRPAFRVAWLGNWKKDQASAAGFPTPSAPSLSIGPLAENAMISVVIPCKNEEKNIGILLDEVASALEGRDYEVLVVDDGSTDETSKVITARMAMPEARLRYIRHDRSAGQSAAVRSGVFAARGSIICTIDGDGQNDPAYLPQLADALIAAGPGAGVAAGQRLKRTDTWLKQRASRFANNLRQAILQDGTRDSGCGLKAVPAELFRALPFFDGWHRYIPALVCREGFSVHHVDVVDRKRRHGQSNYGILDRGLRGVLDLFGVWWLRKRRRVLPAITEIKP